MLRRSAPLLAALLLLIPAWPPGRASTAGRTTAADPVRHGRFTFQTFSDRDGLPQNTVQAMTFDRKGYLWVGTQNGAAYYNGRAWTVVDMPQRQTSNFVLAILAASDGSIWFGSQDGGVSRLSDGRWTVFNKSTGFLSNRVTALIETKAHDDNARPIVWAGTVDGLARFENERWTIVDVSGQLTKETIYCLAETKAADGRRILWAGTGGGLARMEGGVWKLFQEADGLPASAVKSLLDGSSGVLWVGTNRGLASWQNNRFQIFDRRVGAPDAPVISLLETNSADGARTLWAGTDGGGLLRLENNTWTKFTTRNALPSNSVFSLLKSSPVGDGNAATKHLWIGTDGSGLARLQLDQWVTFDVSTGLPTNSVFSLMETLEPGARTLWVGTYGGGLARLTNGRWTTFNTASGLPDNTIFETLVTTAPEGSRTTWVGTKSGGLVRRQNNRAWQIESNAGLGRATVRTMLETTGDAGSRVLWVATGDGLARLERGRWTRFDAASGLPSDNVFDVLETDDPDGEKSLWVATGGGLARYRRGRWSVFNQESGLANNFVMSLHVGRAPDGAAVLWAGTQGGGVSRLDLGSPQPRWLTLTDDTTPALPDNTVNQIREDSRGRIYLYTNKGIARLTPRQPTEDDAAQYSVYTFTIEDGLPSNETNGGVSMIDADGRVWAGTVAGAAVFDPRREVPEAGAAPLYVERVLLNGAERQFAARQKLPYDVDNISFEFALLSFSHEKQTRYRTQLIGLEEQPSDWSADAKRTFTTLPAGDYTFKVWGRDYAGNVSVPVELGFTVTRAPWLRWWALVLYACAVGALAYAGVRYRTRSLKRRNALLELKISRRTVELAEKIEQLAESEKRAQALAQSKSQFLAHMSHEIRTPMNGVLGMNQLLLDTNLTVEQRQYVALANQSGEALMTIIDDVLDFSKIEAGRLVLEEVDFDLATLAEDVAELLGGKAFAKGVEMVVRCDAGVPSRLRGDPVRVRQVLTNLVGNAVKFTKHGEIEICAALEGETETHAVVCVSVTDSGIGISEEKRRHLFEAFAQAEESTARLYGGTGLGLAISRQLIELMGGRLEVDSRPDHGSKFWFTLRLKKLTGADPCRQPLGGGEFAGLRILIADNNRRAAEALSAQASEWGAQTATAGDERTAFAVLLEAARAGGAYDVVLLDAELDQAGGASLARQIKAEAALARTAVVLLVPFGQRLTPERARRLGVRCALTKPVRRSRLRECLVPQRNDSTAGVGDTANPDARGVTASATPEKAKLIGRVLVVEDHAVNQFLAKHLIEQTGRRADVVSNGAEAVAAVAEHSYDLVLMDCQMPVMNGFQATEKIRARENGGPRLPIIAMTAGVLSEEREKCLAAGMDDYLTKPIRPKDVERVLSRWSAPTFFAADGQPDSPAALPHEDGVVLDEDRLESVGRLTGGASSGFLAELIHRYLRRVPLELDVLGQACAAGDAAQVTFEAHKLKGISANLGAARVATLCEQMEKAATGGKIAEAVELLPPLRAACAEACAALEAKAELYAAPTVKS